LEKLERGLIDTAQERHASVPAIFQSGIGEFDAGSLEEQGRGDEADVVTGHTHLLVVDTGTH
jgi:hypothetical protein